MCMRGRRISRGEEDFLFTLYQLSGGNAGKEGVRLVGISSALGVSRAAMSRTASRLARQGLVSKSPYSKVGFTAKGKRRAESVVLRHRVTEVFLHDALGLRGQELERQAHAIEHAMAEGTARKLYAYLGKPEKCPHGKEICR